ncbi:hypothetical protein EJD96_22040 [Herbaspirillum seropedicae]|uniref:hypothetical protein n=1 Tax=Herbaspirillum seropedicae TaxID=964 RepID=UPI0011242C78|nr:hypothetical protein [Herbaspirillum seropedicae]QDD66653.1 hypothetical protein EJD96_22040 [Herbaspirillum seropedicae]
MLGDSASAGEPNQGQDASVEIAPLSSQSNWLASMKATEKTLIAHEYPFYSDVNVISEISEGLGPYQLFNAVPMREDGRVAIAIVLRTELYEDNSWPGAAPRRIETNVDRYHGAGSAEELASLCSLGLGIRLRAGDSNRTFDPRDPRGRFHSHQWRLTPTLVFDRDRPIVPSAIANPSLDSMRKKLQSIPTIEPRLFTELVRSARAYQDALWIAESEPHLAWLLLVSALEIAANAHVAEAGSPESNLRELQPRLAATLESAGGEKLVAEVGEQLKHLYSATKKFLRFCEQFCPPPPAKRPSVEWMKVNWNWSNLKKILNKIYGHRSSALHAGIPFPAPMCRRPDKVGSEEFSERGVTALAESTLGATWTPDDAPMSLNTFQYFVRASLLKWWDHISMQK